MPELPDIVVYLEALRARIVGQPLERIRLRSPFLLRSVTPPLAAAEGRRVLDLRRLGKRIVVGLEAELSLVLHLMVAGRLHWKSKGAKPPARIGLAAFDFPAGTLLLTEAGTKKRASLHLVRGRAALGEHDPGGLEVLDADRDAFRAALTRKTHTLKRALTDPGLFSGIGNAYSDEILHRARLSPFKLTSQLGPQDAERLFQATRQTLLEWIERLRREAGSAFPEKVTAFREGMAVHGRYRQPCPDCGSPVQRIVYAENEANYCATCQTGGRLLADRALSRLLKGDWPRTIEELESRTVSMTSDRPSKKPGDRPAETSRPRPRDRYGRPLPAASQDELSRRGDPAVRSGSVPERLVQAAKLFDERRFFEAHELFEEIWKAEGTPPGDRSFWKGLTQVAVGLCHCQRGNARGARALLARGAAALAGHPSPHRGIDTRALIDAAHSAREQIGQRGASPELDFPRLPLARRKT